MSLKIIVFGQIADITGAGNITVNNSIADTNELVAHLSSQYPSLANAKYAIAVDKKIVKSNTPLNNQNTVALLPPFSGG